MVRSMVGSDNQISTSNQIRTVDDLKYSIETLRRSIEDEKSNNEKLTNILNNLNKNKEITRKKIDGKIIFFII